MSDQYINIPPASGGGGGGTPGGSNGEVQFNNSGAFGGASGVTWDSGTSELQINEISFPENITDSQIIFPADFISQIVFSNAAGLDGSFTGSGNAGVTPRVATYAALMLATNHSGDTLGGGLLGVNGANSVIEWDASSNLYLQGLNWPSADGTAGQAIVTDGAGVLGWADVATVPGVDSDMFYNNSGALAAIGYVTWDDASPNMNFANAWASFPGNSRVNYDSATTTTMAFFNAGNANAGGVPLESFANGTDGQYLRVVSGAPAWSGGGTVAIGDAVTSATANSVLFVDGLGNLSEDNANFYYTGGILYTADLHTTGLSVVASEADFNAAVYALEFGVSSDGTSGGTISASIDASGNLACVNATASGDVSGAQLIGSAAIDVPNFYSSGSGIAFFGVTPQAGQQNTGITPASFTANTSGIADDSATWDGYTVGQIVAALRAYGLLA